MSNEERFTIEEIKNYIISQDSLGDVAYNLNAEKIRAANKETVEVFNEDEEGEGMCDVCRTFTHQGKNVDEGFLCRECRTCQQ